MLLLARAQNLVEYIIRQKVYQTVYWKESCFALTAESLIDKAVDLKAVGGTFGGARKPTNFMCLILKMLQIQPDKEIIIEYIKNQDFKYVRVLGECGAEQEQQQTAVLAWRPLPPCACSRGTHAADDACAWRHRLPGCRRLLHAVSGTAARGLPVPGAPVQRLPQSEGGFSRQRGREQAEAR